MTVAEALDRFLKWCARHRAPSTARQYRSRLRGLRAYGGRELCRFTDGGSDERTVDGTQSFGPLDVEEWYAAAGEGKAADTIRGTAIAWQRFQSWLLDHDVIQTPILKRLEKPRGKNRARIPTDEERDKILAAASYEFGLIYRALLRSGARPGELASAQIAQWQREEGVLRLRAHKTAHSTGEDRVIPVGEGLAAIFEEAMQDRGEGNIFVSPRGKPWTTEGLSRTFRRLRAKLGLSTELVLYSTRHWHGTQIARRHGIRAAQKSLGHRNISTTTRYEHGGSDEQRQAQDDLD